MRSWLVLKWSGIVFETRIIPLGGPGYTRREIPEVLALSPPGTVPVLHLGSDVIADSLAISEWAAEQRPSLWPSDPVARAHARSAACEMHSGFSALRSEMPCNVRRRTEPRSPQGELARDIARIEALFGALRGRFGQGASYLFGADPTIADGFFTPVATRLRTYGVVLGDVAQRYCNALLREPAFVEWEAAALQEPQRIAIWESA
jgi:glutathione S-transferase